MTAARDEEEVMSSVVNEPLRLRLEGAAVNQTHNRHSVLERLLPPAVDWTEG